VSSDSPGGLGLWDRRVVVCVMGIGELGELYVGTRLLQPLHVGPAWADRDVVVGVPWNRRIGLPVVLSSSRYSTLQGV